MRLTRRLLDGLRSPARLAALVRRVGDVLRRGDAAPLLRRIRPRSLTPARYRAWRAAQPAATVVAAPVPFVIALDPVDKDARQSLVETLARPPRGAAMVLVRAAAGAWTPLGGGEARPLAHWVQRVGNGCWIWWIAEPLRLEADAVHALSEACRGAARLVYPDHDVEDESGRPAWPAFKPAWDREQILEHPYAGPLLAVHPTLVHMIDEADAAAGQWAALVEARSALSPEAVVHVPRVVAHLPRKRDDPETTAAMRRAVLPRLVSAAARCGDTLDADVERSPWIAYRVPPRCAASVVIPTRDRRRLLARCIESLLTPGFGDQNEIVVVDNGSRDPGVATLLDEVGRRAPLKVVPMPGPFNFPALCNAGVAAATRPVVVLLNNDTETIDSTWLTELMGLAARPGVGAVGPLLLYPDGVVQSAGVLLGVNRTATSALAGYRTDDPAVRAWCAARRRVSAVLGACLAVERDKYRGIGGMDERLAVSHNELDFCLRLEAAGLANVFTPFARVVHREGGTRGFDVSATERQRLEREEALFKARWAGVLAGVDPAHHPALARRGDPFALAPGTPALHPRAGWRDGVPPRPADVASNG